MEAALSSDADVRTPTDDDRTAAEIRRVVGAVRTATRALPRAIEPAHHGLWFEALADSARSDDARG